MRQADLAIGAHYAVETTDWRGATPQAARVQIVKLDGGGQVTVKVVEPAADTRFPLTGVRAGKTVQIQTRNVTCVRDEWAGHVKQAMADGEERTRERELHDQTREHARADRVRLDPHRPLPAGYDPDRFSGETAHLRQEICTQFLASTGQVRSATHEGLSSLLENVPVELARDVLAAELNAPQGPEGSVQQVFRRAAHLVLAALTQQLDRAYYWDVSRWQVLDDAACEFVAEVRQHVERGGGLLLLPPVPTPPTWLDEKLTGVWNQLGWLRVAVADTSGQRLHTPSFRSVGRQSMTGAGHMPLWQMLLYRRNDLCGVCGGPSMRDAPALVWLVGAVDVWQTRDRELIEEWQIAALLRLIAATATARASVGEPDVTLAARIVTALADDAPGEEGWPAYYLAFTNRWYARIQEQLAQLSPAKRDQARELAARRLQQLAEVLPATQRPKPLSPSADEHAVHERYELLVRMLEDGAAAAPEAVHSPGRAGLTRVPRGADPPRSQWPEPVGPGPVSVWRSSRAWLGGGGV